MDTSVQKIIDAAKRYATAVDAAHLGFDEILVALAALSDDEAIAKAVCRVLAVKKVAWPAELRAEARRAASVDPQQAKDRKFALEPRFKEAFNSLKKEANVIKLDAFIESVLHSRDCSRVQSLWAQKKKRGGLLGRLDECDAKRVRLEAKLAETVIGQEEAIRSLGESYVQLLREPDRPGLRGIFTFVGPPGVGKTFLAEEFASALNEGMGDSEQYEAHLFSMNTSDPAGAILQLFGTPSHYTNGKHGQLYELIQKNPRQILIFDEIEKAHESFIPSLLTLLSAGAFVDQHENERVDASRCYVIFTTNLGQEIFSSPKAAGVARGGRFSSQQIFDLLAAAKRREVAKHEQAPSAFSPEFVDRLRQGSAVLFNRLTIAHYKQLLRKAFASQAGDTLLPPVEISPAAEPLVILSLMPDLTARRLVSEITRLKHRWTDEVMRAELPQLEKTGAGSFKLLLDVDLDAKSTKELDELFGQRTVKILVVDNDERMTRFVKRYAGSQLNQREVHVKRVAKPSEIVDAISKERPDLLLLDLDLDKDQLAGGRLKVLQKQISEAFPSLPLWIFSESRDEQLDELPEWVEEGGVRGYFAFQQDAEDLSIVEEDQQERFSELLQEVVFHRIMLELVRSRSQLTLSYGVVDSRQEDAESVAAGVLITRFTRQQHVSLSINPDQIAPAQVPETTFDDVFGLERAKERLKDAVEMLKNPGRLAKFHETPPSGYLLAGPSGTGKTHLARAVANRAGCLFFSVSCGELESKWVGESEERIRQLFQDARQYAPSVVFIDEIDAIASRRDSKVSEHGTKMLNQLLTCMDGFGEAKGQILVLAATNRPDALDPAIRRPGRFDEIIPIDLPGAEAREQMLRSLLAKKPCEPGIMKAIPQWVSRTARLSPAQIDRVIREAVYLAVRNGCDQISVLHLEAACNLVQYGAEKRDITIREEDRRRTAWHEAGHAVANLILFPETKLDLLTIIPSEEGALGFAAYAADETRHGWSADDFRKRIVMCLAGREAEKLCPGAGNDAVNTGVSSDYEQATRWAWNYVSLFGFDDKFGVFSVAGLPESAQAALSESIQARAQELLSSCLEECRQLMQENHRSLQALADVLLAKQAIYGDEAKKVFDASRA
jgi:cell division protease FtsH